MQQQRMCMAQIHSIHLISDAVTANFRAEPETASSDCLRELFIYKTLNQSAGTQATLSRLGNNHRQFYTDTRITATGGSS